MRHIKTWFLLLCVLLMLPLCAMAETVTVDSAEALQDFFVQCREEGQRSFSFNCSSALLSTLKADGNAELKRLCVLAGMEDFEFRITRSGKITFSGVVYGSTCIAECTTADAARAAIISFMEQNAPEMTLVCSAEVFHSLFREGNMYRLMTELGVYDFTMKGNSLNHIFLSNIVKMTVPYAMVSSVSEAGEKIAAWREDSVPAFNLIFDMDAFNALTREDYRLIAFLGGVEEYKLSYNTKTGMLLFSEVTYSEIPGAYCQSEEEVVSAIRAMGACGITAFQLKLNQETYDKVYANSFARLYELQAQAGMTDSRLSFSSVNRMLIFKDAVITADVTILSSLAEVTAHVEACVQRNDKDITMLLAADVYDDLMAGVTNVFATDAKFYDLIANAGISSADDISFNRQSGALNLKGVHYYAGTNILRAMKTGDASVLTTREKEALSAATRLAASCIRSSDVETAKAIHDALCNLITYTNDETTDEDDCCIGALLDGRANCDGYADAMLLVGHLAGLNVRYQHGDSLEGGLSGMYSTHMWNLIKLDGTWRMIDVTWDDMDPAPVYLWFNIGEDRASRSHIWSREMTVPLQATTDLASRPVAEYFASTAEEVTAAARAAQAAGHPAFDLFVTEESGLRKIATREAALRGLSGSIYYTWADPFLCMHVELVP